MWLKAVAPASLGSTRSSSRLSCPLGNSVGTVLKADSLKVKPTAEGLPASSRVTQERTVPLPSGLVAPTNVPALPFAGATLERRPFCLPAPSKIGRAHV